MTSKVVVGIDYSITSPAACAMTCDGEIVGMLAIATSKKKVGTYKVGSFNIDLVAYPEWGDEDQILRFVALSDMFMQFINKHDPIHTFIEDYAFAAQGQVFNLAENAGILKYRILQTGYPLTKLSPGTIKKHATGSGAATKEKMWSSWLTHHPNIRQILDYNKGILIGSPISDLVDARFVASAGLEAIKSKA